MTFPISPSGVATANVYPTQVSQGQGLSALLDADPGFINDPIIFEPPPPMTAGEPVVDIIATGADPNWGGCSVFMSVDGTTYGQVGLIFTGATQGVLTNTFPAGSDPDTTNTLSVDISESGPRAQIITLPQILADDFLSLCYVGGEIISYSAATLTAPFTYNLDTYIRRGVYGTTIGSHATDTPFALLTQLVFRLGYRENMVGQTIYLKFPSFNLIGASGQNLSDVPAYTYTLLGTGIGPGGAGSLACPVDVVLAGGASEDWGLLGSVLTSSCDWGLLTDATVSLRVDCGILNK